MILKLSESFLSRVPVSKLDWKLIEENLSKNALLDCENQTEENMFRCQENILNSTIFHPLNIKYPLPNTYAQGFLKHLIHKLEKYQCEIHHEILERYTSLVSRNLSDEDAGHRIFLIDETNSIILKENLSIISDGTTGLCTWQAAFYLAEWCICNKEKIAGMKVVELGSGAGFVGLTCYKICQPRFITLTDFHPKVLETLRYNLENNLLVTPSTESCIEIQSLDWMEFCNGGSSLITADVVLASDVVYDADLIPALAGTLSRLLHRSDSPARPPSAIIACTERNENTLSCFLSQLVIYGLTYKLLEHAPPIFVCERSYPVRIYEIESARSNCT